MTLGGRRVAVDRPRVRSADGCVELPLQTYAHFAGRDPLTKAMPLSPFPQNTTLGLSRHQTSAAD